MSNNRKLTKFPVIAEDGTELRVTIKIDDDYVWGPAVLCRLCIPRKRFGYRKLYDIVYRPERDGVYDEDNPDYVAIARQVYADYMYDLLCRYERELREETQAKRKSAAIDAFQAWDGRL